MRPSLLQRMDQWARHLVPLGMTLLLVLATLIPARMPGWAGVVPLLPLMSVYYWSIFRPDLMPAALCFGIGLVYDIVGGTPLGVNTLVFLLVHGAVASQRRFFLNKPFFIAWVAFAIVGGGAMTTSWVLVSILNSTWMDPLPLAISYALTVALYPILSWLMVKIQMRLLRDA